MNLIHKYPDRETTDGFSLIELLVVILILSLLVGILVPSLLKAKILAKKVACAAQLSTLGKAVGLYQGDYGEYVPVCVKNYHPTFQNPWKTWRVNLLPYVPGVNVFNCTATRNVEKGLEIIHSAEEMKGFSESFTMNIGSYGIMAIYAHDSCKETVTCYGPVPPGTPDIYVNTFHSNALSTLPGVVWKNPANSIYIADGCMNKGPVEYPSPPPYKGAGTSHINYPSYFTYFSDTEISRRFADRHKGTNCLFLDGHVEEFITKELDSMIEGDSNCVWDWK